MSFLTDLHRDDVENFLFITPLRASVLWYNRPTQSTIACGYHITGMSRLLAVYSHSAGSVARGMQKFTTFITEAYH
jgi:hypothetical protein